MRHLRALVVCCVLVLPVLAPPPAAAMSAQKIMVRELNEVRAAHGLRQLRPAKRLHGSANGYARWMIRHDWFGHRGAHSSRTFRSSGEILELHRGRRARVARTLRMWMRSPGHRALILSAGFRYVGAGKSRGRFRGRRTTVWVVHFGGRRRK